jgi:hypothetical protein
MARQRETRKRQLPALERAMVSGITIFGATAILNSDDGPSVANDPIYLMAEIIDRGIADGTLHAGSLNNVSVLPPVAEWPERWQFLKEN